MTWHLQRRQRRRLEREKRWLILMAAASAGGPAPQKIFRLIDKELHGLASSGPEETEPESETPLSTADFERMMREENS